MSLSIIIPCKNEEKIILKTFQKIKKKIEKKIKKFQIILVDDYSDDNTIKVLNKISYQNKNTTVVRNRTKGLGGAINLGIENSSGIYIAIMMADESDDINDLIEYNKIMNDENLDAVLGTRFSRKSKVIDYPFQKLILNRFFNFLVSFIFWNKYNDYTNAFKIYKKKTLLEIKPLISESFNIFLEII